MKKLPELFALGIGLGCLGLAGAIASTSIAEHTEHAAASQITGQVTGQVTGQITGQAEKAQPTAQHAALVRSPGR